MVLHQLKKVEEAYRVYLIGYSLVDNNDNNTNNKRGIKEKMDLLWPCLPSVDPILKLDCQLLSYYLQKDNRYLCKQHQLLSLPNTPSTNNTDYDILEGIILGALWKGELEYLEEKEAIQRALQVNPVITYIVIAQTIYVATLPKKRGKREEKEEELIRVMSKYVKKALELAPQDPQVNCLYYWTLEKGYVS